MSVACLVRLGHANAWSYPWSVFASAFDEASEAASGGRRRD